MIAQLCLTILLSLPVYVFCVDRGGQCTTPNDEKAICVTYDSCPVIKNAILYGDPAALNFAKKSACGYDTEPLICCGSSGVQIEKPIQTNVLPDRTICGKEKKDDRIFGGELTEIGEFPWMVLLGFRSNHSKEIEYKCGGTLINNRYVLTAAHCVLTKKRSGLILDSVRLGEWRISTEEDCNDDLADEECADPVVDVKIEQRIPHLGYSRRTGNNDIALLRLGENVHYTDYIRPICLPVLNSDRPQDGTVLVVSGWGTVENGSSSDVKLKLQVPVVGNDYCARKVRINGEVTENQLCAGGSKGKDACQGDSGGPLMATYENLEDNKNQWYQEGVIAWGVGCGRKGFPGIYTRTAKYIDWIMQNMA